MTLRRSTLLLLLSFLVSSLVGCIAPQATSIVTPTTIATQPTPQFTATPLAGAGEITWHSVQLQASDSTQTVELTYALALPSQFDANLPYPIMLALPPGGQDKGMVEAGLAAYWQEAIQRGWVIVSPVAPGGVLFFQGSEVYLPALLDHIATNIEPEGGKFHLSGISNGGISAFRIIISHPERFHSLLVAPGYPDSVDAGRLAALKNIPVAMFVGEFDTPWLSAMQKTRDQLLLIGATVTLEAIEGDQHVIRKLSAQKVFNLLDSYR